MYTSVYKISLNWLELNIFFLTALYSLIRGFAVDWIVRLMFFVHSHCKRIMNIVPVYKQASRLCVLPASTDAQTLFVKCHSRESFNYLDHEFLNRENFC